MSLKENSSLYEVVSKIFRLVPQCTQQLWWCEVPVDGRTTMFSGSVCQVAHSWVYVGSFHKHLFWIVNITCGDFQDGSEKGTASVHQILCQSWEKCYGDPHNDSTWLQGPKLESCTGVSMACPVKDCSYISWQWRTHRETQKLHNSWNCCTNSRVCPSGSMMDHSRHCWGGGNWLWDMPTGSIGRIGHAPCRSQICAQDTDRRPEAVARQHLHRTLSAHLQWWNLLVQGHHWWSELGLWLQSWDKAKIPQWKSPMSPRPKKPERWKAMSRSWSSLSLT